MRKKTISLFLMVVLIFLIQCSYGQDSQSVVNITELNIRDPFILTNKKDQNYILYKSSSIQKSDSEVMSTVVAYKSRDLEHWSGPVIVCKTPKNNWAKGAAWAPEVHKYRGKYYLFVTLTSNVEWKKKEDGWPEYRFRGTQIFYSDDPLGPFRPFSNRLPQTPLDQMALDGTLWVEDSVPYMVYCHEWVQTEDGAIEMEKLKPDLSKAVAPPINLFHASVAPWTSGHQHANGKTSYVTDGCFLYRTKTGKLLMIWSSFKKENYVVGMAESVTGKVTGPWKQQKDLLFKNNGGHGMLFKSLGGKLLLVLHAPNSPSGKERAHIFEVEDLGNTLALKKRLF